MWKSKNLKIEKCIYLILLKSEDLKSEKDEFVNQKVCNPKV